jgi:hypothetical protein
MTLHNKLNFTSEFLMRHIWLCDTQNCIKFRMLILPPTRESDEKKHLLSYAKQAILTLLYLNNNKVLCEHGALLKLTM